MFHPTQRDADLSETAESGPGRAAGSAESVYAGVGGHGGVVIPAAADCPLRKGPTADWTTAPQVQIFFVLLTMVAVPCFIVRLWRRFRLERLVRPPQSCLALRSEQV